VKRYRVLSFDFDSRVSTLTIEIKDDWEAPVIAQPEENRRLTREGLIHQFGAQDFESKCERFIELGNKPFSVVAFHNRFHEEIRRAFVMGPTVVWRACLPPVNLCLSPVQGAVPHQARVACSSGYEKAMMEQKEVSTMKELRFTVENQAGALAKIASALGEARVNIDGIAGLGSEDTGLICLAMGIPGT